MRRGSVGFLIGAMAFTPVAGTAAAQDEPVDDVEEDSGTVTGGEASDTPVTLPLIPVPTGCDAPLLPHVVFIGRPVDDDYRSVRFRVDQVRSGSLEPFGVGDRIDVRYGLDAQYLDRDTDYLVGAVVDPDLGILVSRTAEPIQHFGGDEVIGVSETDVNCPEFEDPMRTLHADGTSIDGGVLDPFVESKGKIAGAFLVPFGVAAGVIFLLSMFRLSLAGLYHSIVGRGRTYG